MNEIIKMKDICKSYMLGDEKVSVLKDIDFIEMEGDFVAILGPSGTESIYCQSFGGKSGYPAGR